MTDTNTDIQPITPRLISEVSVLLYRRDWLHIKLYEDGALTVNGKAATVQSWYDDNVHLDTDEPGHGGYTISGAQFWELMAVEPEKMHNHRSGWLVATVLHLQRVARGYEKIISQLRRGIYVQQVEPLLGLVEETYEEAKRLDTTIVDHPLPFVAELTEFCEEHGFPEEND